MQRAMQQAINKKAQIISGAFSRQTGQLSPTRVGLEAFDPKNLLQMSKSGFNRLTMPP